VNRPTRRFLFRLALLLGRTVGELECGMSSLELSEWLAYSQLDPLPDPQRQTALLATLLVNLWSKQRVRLEDFLPRVPTGRRQSSEEHLRFFETVAAQQAARAR
jgi:hypothetical protein